MLVDVHKSLIERLVVFESDQEIGGFVGVAGGSENFVFVVAEGFQPGA